MLKKLSLILSFLFTLSWSSASAQMFETTEYLCDSCERDLNFKFETTSFQKNNEYESEFATSISGIGVMIKPTFEYYINHNTKVNFGVFGTKFSGRNNFSEVIPIYQIHHKVIPGFELVFGSIYGNLNHGLAEPLYRFDRYYRNNVEYGFQALHKSKFSKSDIWVNWEKFIFEGDPFQEEFTVGNHSTLDVMSNDKYEIKADLQVLLFHKGGEIDTYDGRAIYFFNGAYGIDFKYKTKQLNYSLKPKVFWYRGLRLPAEEDANNYEHYKHGNAYFLSADVDHKFLNFEVGYWNGFRFISSMGESLFMSVSESDADLHQDNREIFYSKLKIKRHVSINLKFELRANFYADLLNDVLPDYSYGLYFVANERFFLKKVKSSSIIGF